MLFRNVSEIQNDRFLIFSLGGPAPCGRRRAIRCTRFARAAPIPAATEPRGGVGIFHAVAEGAGIHSPQAAA